MAPSEEPLRIAAALDAQQIELMRLLLLEYWDSFGFTPDFQGFSGEVEGLPGKYAPPRGRMGVAWIGGEPAGCIALRPIDAERCEAKRLYVRENFRGRGLGRKLLQWVIEEARAIGYREMLGDTMPVMGQALAMYDRFGFERVAPYGEHPTPGAIYLRLPLR